MVGEKSNGGRVYRDLVKASDQGILSTQEMCRSKFQKGRRKTNFWRSRDERTFPQKKQQVSSLCIKETRVVGRSYLRALGNSLKQELIFTIPVDLKGLLGLHCGKQEWI